MFIEGIVNDYLLRTKAKDELSFIFDFDYWTNALPNDAIVVYIYARPPVPQSHPKYEVVEKEIRHQFIELKQQVATGISKTILAFPEFIEYKGYNVEVVLKIEEKMTSFLLEEYLNKALVDK